MARFEDGRRNPAACLRNRKLAVVVCAQMTKIVKACRNDAA